MAQFAVHERRDGEPGYWLDCQHDILKMLSTRFVVPLLPPDYGPKATSRLNPTIIVNDVALILYAQYAGNIEVNELGPQAAWLEHERYVILAAIDVLTGGV